MTPTTPMGSRVTRPSMLSPRLLKLSPLTLRARPAAYSQISAAPGSRRATGRQAYRFPAFPAAPVPPVLANELGGFQQYRRTRRAANARPFSAIKGVSGCLYRLINVFNGPRRIGANDNIVGRAFTDKTFAAVARGPFTIDEHLKFTRFSGSKGWLTSTG